ncbi:MAG TPA: S8 family serine peptidase [Terriglobia bacterium]|nr:S8 family serine peptidase [Terriglobia bacterium]
MRRRSIAAAALVVCALAALLGGAYSFQHLAAQQQPRSYLLRLRDDAVIEHVRRLAPRPLRRLNLHAEEAARYRALLLARQGALRQRLALWPDAEVREQMDTVFNGLAVRLRPQDVAAIAQLPEVAAVFPSVPYQKALDAAGSLVRLPAAWAEERIGGEANAGAGIKIGIIDTGIDITHPMFEDPSLSPPPGFPLFTPSTSLCLNSDRLLTNSKVIVARNYVRLLPNPDLHCDALDRDGHGTFVAGIAAGRRVQGPLANIAGVAPKAFLGSYKVFGTPGFNDSASLEAIIKAIDDATKDGMDIINLSLGANIKAPPSQDPLAQAVAAAVSAGVTVVVAAGNTGPGPATITSPGTAPEAITVGSTTNSRVLAIPLTVSAPVPVPQELQRIAAVAGNGFAMATDVGPAPLADVGVLDPSGLACGSLPAGTLTGKLVLIRRGGCLFETKILNAARAGALSVIVYNHLFQQSAFPMDVGAANQIPAVMIGNTEGTALASFLAAAGSGVLGRLGAQPQPVPTEPDRMADFSAAGPSTDFGIKPDLVAPGTDLYSAEQRNFPAGSQYSASGFGTAEGTSFSAPMVAGAAALIKQANPGFTPSQIKSALVNTAVGEVVKPLRGGLAGALASGNGRLDVAAALASPATIAPVSFSFGNNAPGSSVDLSFQISVQNVSPTTDTFTLTQISAAGSAAVTLTATPATFSMPPGTALTVSIQAVSPQPVVGVVEGALVLRSANTGRTLSLPYWGNFLLPTINTNGIVNAASLVSGPSRVAPGSLISIFGTQLTSGGTAAAASVPLPGSLAGTTVLIGGREAPLLFVSPTQINAQVPQEEAGRALTTAQVIVNGAAGALFPLPLATTSPGIFAVNQAGTGRGAVLHSATHTAVSPSDPARPGEILEVYVNGLGPTVPAVETGDAAGSTPLSIVTFQPSATLGGLPATVHFAGLAPFFVGLYQVNIAVPAGLPPGEVPLVLTSNGVASNPVTIAVAP